MHTFIDVEVIEFAFGDPTKFTRFMISDGNRTAGCENDEPNIEMKMRWFIRRPNLVNV